MTNKIELFIMIVERNRVTRAAFNCRMKLAYHYRMMRKYYTEGYPKGYNKHAEVANKYEAEESKLTDEKYAFTKRTHKRRLELQRELKTEQISRADNRIMGIRLKSEGTFFNYYPLGKIERIVEEYKLNQKIDSILLGSE